MVFNGVECPGSLLASLLGPARLAWVRLGSPVVSSPGILGSPGFSWALLGSPGLSWALLGASGRSWALLGSPGLSWALPGSPVLPWAWARLDSPGNQSTNQQNREVSTSLV